MLSLQNSVCILRLQHILIQIATMQVLSSQKCLRVTILNSVALDHQRQINQNGGLAKQSYGKVVNSSFQLLESVRVIGGSVVLSITSEI